MLVQVAGQRAGGTDDDVRGVHGRGSMAPMTSFWAGSGVHRVSEWQYVHRVGVPAPWLLAPRSRCS